MDMLRRLINYRIIINVNKDSPTNVSIEQLTIYIFVKNTWTRQIWTISSFLTFCRSLYRYI